jgi:GTP-binding protein
MNSYYLTGAQKPQDLPQFGSEVVEVAFIGRSNSGKSSLINTLTQTKNLARASATPGRTQMIHFFQWEKNKQEKIVLADLPGYGFNVARKEIQKLWDDLLDSYLERPTISYFCYLFDVRRDWEDFEWEFIQELNERQKLLIILTKCDKLSHKELTHRINVAKDRLFHLRPMPEIVPVSNLKGQMGTLTELLFPPGDERL